MFEYIAITHVFDGQVAEATSFTDPGCGSCTMYDMSEYLVAMAKVEGIEIPSCANLSSLQTTCVNGISCAWGPGMCTQCLLSLENKIGHTVDNRAGGAEKCSIEDAGWFAEAFVEGGANATAEAHTYACSALCNPLRLASGSLSHLSPPSAPASVLSLMF